MIKKTELIQVRVTEQEKTLLKDLAHKNFMNLSDYVRYCVLKDRVININFIESKELEELKKYLNEKINQGKEKFPNPSEEAFEYWDSLKKFFNDINDINDNCNPADVELKRLYWEILLNWELNKNRQLYKELSML